MALDPSAEKLMELASELLAAQDRLARQQNTIWVLMSALKAERAASTALADLLDAVLANGDG